jgi:class 3 adenylate cyclase
MRATLLGHAARLARLEVQIRVGVNSGDVLVRSIGTDLHMDYTAVGQTTHLAARMEQLAPPGGVRITADTLRLAEGYVTVAPLGLVPVKGLTAPIEVYELTGAVGGPRALSGVGAPRSVALRGPSARDGDACDRARRGKSR